MSLLTTPADGVGLAGAHAGQIVAMDDNGALTLAPNLPTGQLWGHYGEFENGAAGQLGQGLHAWTPVAIGAGAQRVPLTGEAGWFQGSASIETGTTTTGLYMMTRSPSGIMFSSTSGTWIYECTFAIPVLSDGTNTYQVQIGFFDNLTSGASLFHGATLIYTHTLNGGKFQANSANGAVLTTADTGVTLVAGNYYHARIEILNNTQVTFYLKTVFSGSAWSDDGVWSFPVATISTNVPTGTSFKVFPGIFIQKSAGTTSSLIKLGYQVFYRVPATIVGANITRYADAGLLASGDGVGMALGGHGTALATTHLGVPGWVAPGRIRPPIVYFAYGRAGWQSSPPHDFGAAVGGTGSTGGVGTTVLDNGLGIGGTGQFNSGFASDSYAAFHTATAIKLDATVQPLVLESVLGIASLSASGQQTVTQFGLFDSAAGGPSVSNGVWIEFDAVNSAAAQCKTRNGATTTTVSSGLTIAINTMYLIRIVVTSTSVQFWIAADDATQLGSPVATISTNIPTSTALAIAAIQRNLAGTTGRVMQLSYCLGYQRSTT